MPYKWLDTGGGTGYLIEKAYPSFKNTHFILADPSKDMLAQARIRLKHIPKQNIEILTPISSQDLAGNIKGKVDVITALLAHHYLDKNGRKNATKNIYDLLSEGGIYVTFENVYPSSEKGTELGLKRWSDFQIKSGRAENEVLKHTKRFNMGYYPINLEEHLDLLEQTGFKVYEVLWYAYMQVGLYAIK